MKALAKTLLLLACVAASVTAQEGRVIRLEKPFRGETHAISKLELREAKVVDAIRLISEISGLNVVSTKEAGDTEVTLYLQDIDAARAVETICKVGGLWFRRDTDTETFRVLTTTEYQKDHIVYRKDEIRVFTLQHPNSIAVATAIEDLFGYRVQLSLGVDHQQANDMPSGIGGGMGNVSPTFGGGSSQVLGGSNFRQGVNYNPGDFRRGYGSSMYGGRGRGREGRESERILDEELTPDQLDRLEEQQAAGELTGEQLKGVSRQDPSIWVTVNRQHNLIVVRTSDGEAMEEIASLVADLDRPTPQVLLEMKILELQITDGFRSIFDVQYTGGPQTGGPATSQPVNPLLPEAVVGSRNTLGLGNFDLDDSTLVYQFVNDNVMARLQLLATDGRINVLATPMVLASNNQPARMFVGEEAVLTRGINVETVTGAVGATTQAIEPITEIRDVGQTLFLVPKINADRTVTLMLVQDSSIVEKDGATIPVPDGLGGVRDYPIDTVNTANLQATVVAKDGMTLAVGGLIRVELLDREEKVPVLGDIPVLRFFFRKKVTSREKQELILLIRPHVLFTPTEADAVTKERLRAMSDHPYSKLGDRAYDTDLASLRRKIAKEEARVEKQAEKDAEKDREKAEKEAAE